jgi:hypothetical protein
MDLVRPQIRLLFHLHLPLLPPLALNLITAQLTHTEMAASPINQIQAGAMVMMMMISYPDKCAALAVEDRISLVKVCSKELQVPIT